jgi:cytochrome P450
MPILSAILVWRFDECVSASGSVPCIVVSTAAVAKEIFQHNDAVFSSRRSTLNSEVTYGRKSMGTAPYGPYWRQIRKVYSQELFSPRRQASYESSKLEEIRHMMKNLLNECKQGNDVNLKSWSTGVTGNIMTRMLMNKRYSKRQSTCFKPVSREFFRHNWSRS